MGWYLKVKREKRPDDPLKYYLFIRKTKKNGTVLRLAVVEVYSDIKEIIVYNVKFVLHYITM